ncbi:hypothetical protein [Saccharicrinis sp. GN24d3]|uniref:hypothetical protein n=1 Tax=Saccharicrinis sp. GN24d3 TaxID=3458416 RepID=UPI0040357960
MMMQTRNNLLSISVLLLFTFCSKTERLPVIDYKFENAVVKTGGDKLIVSTGKVERVWKMTDAGLRTVSFRDYKNGEIPTVQPEGIEADWAYFGLIDGNTKGKLISLTAKKSNDENFTSDHIEIVAEFNYPQVESAVKYVIWAYPDAPGIRTQLYIKGKADKYLSKPGLKKREDVQFDLVSGLKKNDYAAGAFAERCITTTLQSETSVQFHAKGLEMKKQYKLGFTWWDFSGKGIVQDVRITSVDGETNMKVVSSAKLPDFKNSRKKYETIIVDLPSEALMDGTCRIFFDRLKGDKAQVSEIFIYEKGDREIEVTNGTLERLDEIRADKPLGYSLVGYLDCGEPIQGEKRMATGRVDYLPVNTAGTQRTYMGYYNDTQHRNKPDTPILKEKVTVEDVDKVEKVNWTNMVRIDKDGKGVMMVKESHKCVNQYGVETGEFLIDHSGLRNTGTSLFPYEISADEYKWCWASWSILYAGGQDECELALKQFDRLRYPVDPNRDIYVQANTWGSGHGREASKELNVLRELESQADLGIDIQQIDDGWQNKQWTLRKDWYPDGWANVVAKSNETGVKIGLWAAAMPVTYESLKWNYDNAGFLTYKLDFASLGNHSNMEKLIGKIRKFVAYTDHKVRVNWDLTENAPRFGYFWAREYGCIYLENRKPDKPENVVYIPHLVLRDIWHVSKYTNINKFQTSIQNIEKTNRRVSDAYLHNHPYAVAIGLVGTPLFFQETQYYSDEARNQIRPLLATYKNYREEMYDSYVFPLGDEPNNGNWTGFQWVNPSGNTGYVMIFRELNNSESKKEIAIRFFKNKTIELTNIETGEIRSDTINEKGELKFELEQPASFKFLRYEVAK